MNKTKLTFKEKWIATIGLILMSLMMLGILAHKTIEKIKSSFWVAVLVLILLIIFGLLIGWYTGVFTGVEYVKK